jgi:hypothetical protein
MTLNHHIRKKCNKVLTFLFLTGMITILSPKITLSQEAYQLQEMFMNAESWFYFQDYKNSLPLYLKVNNAYPENDNINYKIGFCYLNIDGQEHKAIPYLEKAAENTTFSYTRESFYERKAPVDAIFYLGNAYRKNNQLDKAIETYKRFENKVKNRKSIFFNQADYDFEYLQKQLQACETAKEMMKEPVNYTAENLGLPVNTPQSEFKPVISGDGKTLIFTAEKKFYTGVFMSKKENGKWGPPINLLPQLGIDGDCETTSISYDGTELYLYREDELDGNLYVSHFKNGEWSKIKKLGPNINTKYWESHADISTDGQKLYFTSNREGGYGELDIYVSQRNSDGTWGEAKNLGSSINSQWREDTPHLTKDGEKLFFSSEGHHNMGGFDLFVARKTPNGWSNPKNMGYPLNTPDDDKFLMPYNEGEIAYHAKFNRDIPGMKDIYKYNIGKASATDFIQVEGILTYKSPENKKQKDFHINIINKETKDTIAKLRPDEKIEGKDIAFKTPTGKNHLIYKTPQLKDNKQYIISQDYEIKERYLETKETAKLEPKEESEQEKPQINLEKEVFKGQAGEENIKIKLQLKGGNKLIVNTFSAGELINTEEFSIDEEEFIYEYTPKKEESKLTFSLLNGNQQIYTKDVKVALDSLEKLTADKDTEAKLEIEEKSFTLSPENKKIKIKLSVEKGAKLFVETFVDNKLINKEEFDVEQDQFTYEFEPEKKQSKLNFKVIDKNQNVKNREIVISHKPITSELKTLLGDLNQFSTSQLIQRLDKYSLEEMTSQALIDSLWQDTLNSKIETRHIETLVYTNILLSEYSAEELLQKLQEIADGELKTWLDSLTPNDISSKEDLIKVLLQGSMEGKFTRSDVNKLLGDFLASTKDKEYLHKSFNEIALLNLQNILNKLDAQAINIATPGELIAYFSQKGSLEAKQTTAFLIANGLATTKFEAKPKIAKPVIKDKPSRGFLYILTAVVLGILIIYILTLIKRRRSNNSES